MFGIVGAILGLGLLIVVHEAGHFVVARWCGMRVERFSIGFGPGVFKRRSKAGTIFQLAPIPFGGFVEIKGMNIAEDIDPDDVTAYPNRPVWQRIATIFAGPGTNYLTAVVLAFGLYTCAGVKDTVEYYGVDATEPGFDAHGKLLPGDRILQIDSKPIWWQGPHGEQHVLSKITNDLRDRPTSVVVSRDGRRVEVMVQARLNTSSPDPAEHRWQLGIKPRIQVDRNPVGVLTAAGEAFAYPWRQTQEILTGLYLVITGQVPGEFGGALMIGDTIKSAIEVGAIATIELLMVLNVYLGLFNLLPLPALDGGRLVFLGYELATRRRANPKIEATVHMIGILFLLVVMVLVTVKDIRRVF